MTMAAELSGDQWNRRCLLFGGAPGFCRIVFTRLTVSETFLTILNQMEVYPAVVDQENQYGPFLATTTVLMEAVKAGAGREEAHEATSTQCKPCVTCTPADRPQRSGRPPSRQSLGLPREQLAATVAGTGMVGMAADQVDHARRFARKRRHSGGACLPARCNPLTAVAGRLLLIF